MLLYGDNQPITNDNFKMDWLKYLSTNINIIFKRGKSYLVGISETTRTNSELNKKTHLRSDIKFNEWLAGLIDGDGTINVSKQGYTSCEITVALADEKALRIIQNKLGGSIKLRSGVKAIRYRLHNKEGMFNLISRINGNIRNTKRLVQLHKACSILNIPIMNPIPLTENNSWFIGFFDADGTIGYSIKNGYPQLTISVTNKLLIDVQPYLDIFGGNIYFDKAQNGNYKWSIQSKKDVLNFLGYVKNNPSRTIKQNRLLLCHQYYELHSLQAYKLDNTLAHQAWIAFENKWNRRDLSE